MITGIVTSNREARVRLTILGVRGRRASVDAVIDTGFDGFLCLPPTLIERLRLRWRDRRRAVLADGSETIFDVYRGTVLWDRQRREISVHAADGVPLIGMALLGDFTLRVDAWSGGRVTIRRRGNKEK